MKWIHMIIPVVVLTGSTVPAQAQFFRKPKLNLQVPELLSASKTEPDERKRLSAVEQLRDFDARNHPEIVPALIDLLLSDPKSNIRLEAVNSLSKIRPVSQQAGQALESAAQRDDNWRVRWQAKTSLWSYQMAGYRSSGTNQVAPVGPSTKEPPLADGATILVTPQGTPLPTAPLPLPGGGPTVVPSMPVSEVPTIPTRPAVPQGSSVSFPRPLPSRPAGFSTALPQGRPTPPPPPAPSSEGPVVVPIQP